MCNCPKRGNLSGKRYLGNKFRDFCCLMLSVILISVLWGLVLRLETQEHSVRRPVILLRKVNINQKKKVQDGFLRRTQIAKEQRSSGV